MRQFIRDANTAKLSPVAKDAFLYYYSCTQNESGEWYCDDASTAAETYRSRNGICEARKELIKKEWITENGQFNIKTLKKFSVGNATQSLPPVAFPTENHPFESEMRLDDGAPVGNATQPPHTPHKDISFLEEQNSVGIEAEKECEKTPAPEAHRFDFLSSFSFSEIHKHFFPKYELSLKDAQVIKTRIFDKRAWICALFFWDENNYRAESIGKQCDKHDEILKKEKQNDGSGQNTNGNGKRYGNGNAGNGSATAETTAEYLERIGANTA